MSKIELITFDLDDTFWDIKDTIINAEKNNDLLPRFLLPSLLYRIGLVTTTTTRTRALPRAHTHQNSNRQNTNH